MSAHVTALFLAHRQELEAYLTRRLRDADTAAELTQEAFLRFTEKVCHEGECITHPRSYLFRTAHNLAIDFLRQQPGYDIPGDEVDLEQIIDEAPTPDDIVGAQNEIKKLHQILAELPERTQQIFTLCRINGLTYRQVADLLEISESSVQKHLAQALKYTMQKMRN